MTRFLVASFVAAATASLAVAQPPAPPVAPAREARTFELRTYYAADGKFDALNARFRDHAVRLFAKHGMTPVGFWSPVGNPDNKLVFLLAYPSRAARDAAWKSLAADPEWVRARKATDQNGKLVKFIEEAFLVPTDYSPVATPASADTPRTFELRMSTVRTGDLDRLHAQLRNGGVKELERQGVTPIGFFTVADARQTGEVTFVSLLAHTAGAAKEKPPIDPILLVAIGEPQLKPSAGTITAAEGKKSEVLTPTDYSPLK